MSTAVARRRTNLVRVVAPIVLAAVVLAGIGLVLWDNASSAQASSTYQQRRHALDARLQAARQQGYTSQDLAPVTSGVSALDGTGEPWWIPSRPGYYQQKAVETSRLQAELDALQARLFGQAQTDAAKLLSDARSVIGQAQQAKAADPDVQAIQQRLDTATKARGAAHTLKDYRSVAQQGQAVLKDAGVLLTQTQQENQAIVQSAQQIAASANGDVGAVQQAGNQALAAGRNEATEAAYLNKGTPLKGFDAVQRAYNRLEKFAGLVGSGDLNQAAQGTAAAQRYAGQIHDALSKGLPSQVVLISFQDQHLWAYQNGQVVMDSATTTGIRGVSDFGTDFGPMKVLWKDHPHKMQSPWPKGSPYWYPDTMVQWATFFTRTGESIHDASWEPDSALGPGSQNNPSFRSHGCVHIPLAKAQWMYDWAPVGMQVVVYPGDGTPVANQLSQITTDDQGNPQSAG
jgi:lipoprotein-anchoring transpeptidase ErfK/SrfK